MTTELSDQPCGPPGAAALIPIVLLLHQAEEWFGGFPAWTRFALGDGVDPERFLLVNATGLMLISFGTLAAFQAPRMAWIVALFAALLGLNGVLHALASVWVGRYSPGTATGLLLSLPLAVVVLRASAHGLPRTQFFGAVLAGCLGHGAVTVVALA